MPLPRIAVITTGGTISMRYDARLGGAVPAVSGDELLQLVPGLDAVAQLELIEFSNLPSCHLTPAIMFDLCRLVQRTVERPDLQGVVVTHGTDALEETAYMSDLWVDSNKPVVFTAAMRNNSEIGCDGPRNILAAVRVATCRDAWHAGTLVVFNGRILAARDTIKMHTSNMDAFRSPMLGPVGNVDDDAVVIFRRSLVRQSLRPQRIVTSVDLMRVYGGMDSEFIFWSLERGNRGLVLEAMGQGNVPPALVPGLRAWIDAGRPVVLVSRCPEGRALDTYAYEGGGKQLHNMGVIFGEDLTGQKARIKLMLALGLTSDPKEIRAMFEYLI
ncbi:MAG: asparaginase [Chloroflexia bacterium]